MSESKAMQSVVSNDPEERAWYLVYDSLSDLPWDDATLRIGRNAMGLMRGALWEALQECLSPKQ